MRIFGPNSGQRHYLLLFVLSILAFSIAPGFACAAKGKGWGHSSTQLSIGSVGPNSRPATGGTSVTISGTGFTNSASVSLGGVAAASVVVVSSTELQAVTPAHPSGTVTPAHSSGFVDVSITNSNGQSATLASGFAFHSIDLMWNAPSTSTVTVAGYNVYRGNALAGPFSRISGSTPLADTLFTDATVQGGTTYYYEVRSVDSSGTEGAPAGPVSATTSP